MTDPVLQSIVDSVEYAAPIVRASQYLTLSGCSFLLYDYFLTLAQEIEFIWKAPKSTISIIYLTNRYIIPVILAIDIYDRLGLASSPSVTFCKAWVWIEGYTTVLSFMTMHGLVAMRVNALLGGGNRVKTFLWAIWLIYSVSTLGLLGVGLWNGYSTLTVEPYFNVCFEEIWDSLWIVWLPSLLLESALFFLTTLKAIKEASRNVYHPISTILYRDGILYFLAIAVATMFSMFVWLFGSSLHEGLAKYWATAVVNVAGCRLVLNLKMNGRSLQYTRARSALVRGESSSFVVGSDSWLSDSGYCKSDDDESYISDEYQLGTIYPEQYQSHWDAI